MNLASLRVHATYSALGVIDSEDRQAKVSHKLIGAEFNVFRSCLEWKRNCHLISDHRLPGLAYPA